LASNRNGYDPGKTQFKQARLNQARAQSRGSRACVDTTRISHTAHPPSHGRSPSGGASATARKAAARLGYSMA
jgi:hypothetical protein